MGIFTETDRERHLRLADRCTEIAASWQLRSLSMEGRSRWYMQRDAAKLRINAADHRMLAGERNTFSAEDFNIWEGGRMCSGN